VGQDVQGVRRPRRVERSAGRGEAAVEVVGGGGVVADRPQGRDDVPEPEYAAAERAWDGLLAHCERELGPNHPATIVTLDRLGSALFRLRRPPESADRHRKAHCRAVGTFGRTHPDTLTFAHNLGCALVVAHQWDEGLPVLRDTLKRRRKKLGGAHPDSLDTANLRIVLPNSRTS
jgi:hypothetical protein